MIVRVIFMLLACLVIDLLLRQHFRRLRDMRERQDLEKLQVAPVRLAFSDDAPSLRRVEVAGPKARILAVVDEMVVLVSYRRILAPEGYSIDTVETGPEALSLLRLDAYDFVIEECLEKYRAGMKLLDIIMTLPPADATIGSELEAVHVFEARRELRRALVITLLAEGMAVKKISAIFNVPLQSVTDIAGAIGKPID